MNKERSIKECTDWLSVSCNNARRYSKEMHRDTHDRDGWAEDANYYEWCIRHLEELEELKPSPHPSEE